MADIKLIPVIVPPGFILTAEQQELFDYFSRYLSHQGVARRFLGALRAFADQLNPEHICLTAHCLREIMTAIELRETASRPLGLNERFKQHLALIAVPRKEARRLLESGNVNLGYSPAVDYIRATEEFYGKFEEEQTIWNRRVEAVLLAIDPLFQYEDAGWRVRVVMEWRKLKDDFNRYAHSTPVEISVFEETFQRWITFMLARIRPKTNQHQMRIRESIRLFED